MEEAKSINRYIRMSPKKVQRVLNQIRGKNYKEALLLLEFLPYKACGPIWNTLHSAASNASHNYNQNKEALYISEAFVNQGPILRRFRPRAQGRGYKIKKPTCHITIQVKPLV